MKMKYFYKLLILAVIILSSTFTASARNSANNIVYNLEEENGVLVRQTLYKQEGKMLSQYIRYNYTYDKNNRIVESNILKWNNASNKWDKCLTVRYLYDGQDVSTRSYKWNKQYEEYELMPKFNTEFTDPSL